jgi:hypothetical protein
MDFKIEFTNKEISPWAGILLQKKVLDKMQFDNSLLLFSNDNFGLIESCVQIIARISHIAVSRSADRGSCFSSASDFCPKAA